MYSTRRQLSIRSTDRPILLIARLSGFGAIDESPEVTSHSSCNTNIRTCSNVLYCTVHVHCNSIEALCVARRIDRFRRFQRAARHSSYSELQVSQRTVRAAAARIRSTLVNPAILSKTTQHKTAQHNSTKHNSSAAVSPNHRT